MAQANPVLGHEPEGFGRSRSLHQTSARLMNNLVIIFCWFSALLAIGALFAIFGYVLYRGVANLDLALFTNLPNQHPPGLRNAIAGTFTLILMASVVGIPLGMLCGTYLAEYAKENWFSQGLRLVVDLLAGVPSIIVGILTYTMVVRHTGGSSAYAGAVALGFMMCPIIAKTTEEMLKLVPKSLREASIGLGASKTQTLMRVVIPGGSAGIITGIMLAVARVAGETAPLLFTVGDSNLPIYEYRWSSTPLIWLFSLTGIAVVLLALRAKMFHKQFLTPLIGVGTIAAIAAPFCLLFSFMSADLSHEFPTLTVKVYSYTERVDEKSYQAWSGMLILITLVLMFNILVRVASSKKKFKAN